MEVYKVKKVNHSYCKTFAQKLHPFFIFNSPIRYFILNGFTWQHGRLSDRFGLNDLETFLKCNNKKGLF